MQIQGDQISHVFTPQNFMNFFWSSKDSQNIKKNDASFVNKCSKDVLEHIFILNKQKFSKSASLWLYRVAKMEKIDGLL